MSQIFHRSANTLSKASIFGALFLVAGIIVLIGMLWQSPYVTQAGVVREQPVPFSHEHHARGLGIDCRYCHTSVEESSVASLPSTKTCMTCHSQIWTNAELLAPVREAYRTGMPIQWTRVHNLPRYVFFDHHIHVAKGVACTTCHGPVDRMPLMYQQNSLQMSWCLDCHRHPERSVGPQEAVFKSNWSTPNEMNLTEALNQERRSNPGTAIEFKSDAELGQEWVKRYHVKSTAKLADCYTCHR